MKSRKRCRRLMFPRYKALDWHNTRNARTWHWQTTPQQWRSLISKSSLPKSSISYHLTRLPRIVHRVGQPWCWTALALSRSNSNSKPSYNPLPRTSRGTSPFSSPFRRSRMSIRPIDTFEYYKVVHAVLWANFFGEWDLMTLGILASRTRRSKC